MELDETRARPRVPARWCTPFQASETLTVDYASSDVIATTGADYIATTGTLIILPQNQWAVIRVLVRDDAHDEGEEALELTFSNPSGARLA